jgi:DNA-binding response OmpR family regulator
MAKMSKMPSSSAHGQPGPDHRRVGPVLVVDDDEAVRTSFANVLRVAGFDVVEMPDGTGALELIRAQDVAAVLLDVGLPDLDGLSMLDCLDDPPPVVLATAHPYNDEVIRRRDKVFSFIMKPVPPDTLIAKVAEAVAAEEQT